MSTKPCLTMADGGAASPYSIRGIYERVTKPPPAKNPTPEPQAETKATPTQAAPAAPPAKAISEYSGMSAMQRREKEAGLKDGGELVTGKGGKVPGKGTGDTVDAKYEPGEIVVSNAMLALRPGLARELAALRAKALKMQGKTVKEANEGQWKDGKMKAKDGKTPEELANQTAMYVQGAQAAAASRPPQAAPTPPPVAVAAPAAPSGADFSNTRAVAGAVADEVGDAWKKGRGGAVIGQLARGGIGTLTAGAVDLLTPAARVVGGLAGGAANAVKTFATGDSTPVDWAGFGSSPAAPVAPATAPVVAQAAPPSAQAATPAVAPASVPAPAAVAAPVAAAAPAAPANGITRIDAPGQSPMFTNAPGDAAFAASRPISAQNQQAFNNLPTTMNAAPAAQYPQEMQQAQAAPEFVRHSGNDWSIRKNLENLATGGSSITKPKGRGAVSPEMLAYKTALETDAALRQGKDEALVSRNRDAAFMDRTAAAERGMNSRQGMISRIAQQNTDIERTKTGMLGKKTDADVAQAGAETRLKASAAANAERIGELEAQYAKAAPADRAAIAQQIHLLNRTREAPDQYQGLVVKSNQIDAPDQVVSINQRTGQVLNQKPSAPASTTKVGASYNGPDGKIRLPDGRIATVVGKKVTEIQ